MPSHGAYAMPTWPCTLQVPSRGCRAWEMYMATRGSGKQPKREGLMMLDSAPFSMNCVQTWLTSSSSPWYGHQSQACPVQTLNAWLV